MYGQLFLHSSQRHNFTFTGRSHTLWLKIENLNLCVHISMFLNCGHIYCYHLNRKLYIVLGTDNLNIQIGGTPKLHTLGRYSDSSAKTSYFLKLSTETLNTKHSSFEWIRIHCFNMRSYACRKNSCVSVVLLPVIFAKVFPPYFDEAMNTAFKQEWF